MKVPAKRSGNRSAALTRFN